MKKIEFVKVEVNNKTNSTTRVDDGKRLDETSATRVFRGYLMSFLEDGRIELSNNRAERTIKPFVIGKKLAICQYIYKCKTHLQ